MLQVMEVTSEFGGMYFMVHDATKNTSILLSRDTAQTVVENERNFSATLLKLMQRTSPQEEVMKELGDNVVMRFGYYHSNLRIDIRQTARKDDGGITFTRSGVNMSVHGFIQFMRYLKKTVSHAPFTPVLDKAHIDADEDDTTELTFSPTPSLAAPPKSKRKPSLARSHAIQDGEDTEDVDEPSTPRKKARQTLSRTHHPKGVARVFRKAVKAVKPPAGDTDEEEEDDD